MYSNKIYEILDNALDYGITEHDFWEMTFAELNRQVKSKQRVQKIEEEFQAKQTAANNYIQALLIGRVMLSAFNKDVEVPPIHEVYPTLFQENKATEEAMAKNQDLLSALRFKQFAHSFNQKYHKEEQKVNE